MTAPHATCATCSGALYPLLARRTEAGWVHADRRECEVMRRRIAAAHRAEDVRWMAATGECLSRAAERLGTTADALEKWLRLRGMDSERRTLMSREPIGLGWERRQKVGAA